MKDLRWKSNIHWIDRTIMATDGSRLCEVLKAALEKHRDAVPRFEGQACIDEDGFIVCDLVDKYGFHDSKVRIGLWTELQENAALAADMLRFNRAEYHEFDQLLREWTGQHEKVSAEPA